MRIIQWNTHHGGKGVYVDEPDKDEKLDIARFATALGALKPDIVCLNEVQIRDGYGNVDQLEVFRVRLGAEFQAFGAHTNGKPVTPGSSGQCNAILSRWPIEQPQIKALVGGRVAIAALIKGVTIIATHLDDQTAATRAAEVTQLANWVGPISAQPLVVCGDWNAVPPAPELAPLLAALQDAWTVGVDHRIASSWNGTGHTRKSRIDAVFFRGLALVKVDVPDTRVGIVFPSDHAPVVADFADVLSDSPEISLGPLETSRMMLCSTLDGAARTIDVWTLFAVTAGESQQSLAEAGALADGLKAWCQQYGPWDPLRPRRSQ